MPLAEKVSNGWDLKEVREKRLKTHSPSSIQMEIFRGQVSWRAGGKEAASNLSRTHIFSTPSLLLILSAGAYIAPIRASLYRRWLSFSPPRCGFPSSAKQRRDRWHTQHTHTLPRDSLARWIIKTSARNTQRAEREEGEREREKECRKVAFSQRGYRRSRYCYARALSVCLRQLKITRLFFNVHYG